MKRLNVLVDSEILLNGLNNNSGRSGIFFASYNIIKLLLIDDRIDLSIYCKPAMKNIIVRFFFDEFSCKINDKVFVEGDDLSGINSFFSPVLEIPQFVSKKYSNITCYTIIYDVIPLLLPHYFATSLDWFENVILGINKEDYYFAISEYTKQDFVKHVPAIDENKISVIPMAAAGHFYCNKDRIGLQRVKDKYNIPITPKYVFSLCTLEERKNLIRAVTAFVLFIEKNKIDDLIFVLGGGHWDTFIGRIEKEVPNFQKYADRIVKAGYVDDEDFSVLFSNAEWFVYTSQYEGFGMPPLEAMQCGCPVITSNNSSLPEVVGDAAIMIDYDSIEQHVKSYERYYYDSVLRTENANKGLRQTRKFNWEIAEDLIVRKMIEIEQIKRNWRNISVKYFSTLFFDVNIKKKDECQIKRYYLLDFIPIIKEKKKRGESIIYCLFDVLILLKVEFCKNIQVFSLLGFIPILSIREVSNR